MLIPIIMAGGSGTRLWPLSRSMYPKQFLPLAGMNTMLQETALRLGSLEAELPVTICNNEHRFLVAEQLKNENLLGDVILEPVGRNTAPAIAVAAYLKSTETDPLLLVLAADHVIQNVDEFVATVKRAIPLAESGKLVTFGIVPSSAHTGYGYIKRGAVVEDAFDVAQFIEKPDVATAEKYLASNEYYWNSGMFLFKASRYLEELTKYRSDIAAACKKSVENVVKDLDFIRLNDEAFYKCPDESIDYAVMEHTDAAVVMPLDAGWNDIGSWSAMWNVAEKCEDGNAAKGDVIMHNSSNCFVHGEERLVTTVGLDDIVIIDTKDALLVAKKDSVQDVKTIVTDLKKKDRSEVKLHREVYRPWGKYDSVDVGDRYQVKRITVKPRAKLSVQMHHHRAEHWIVVSGIAKVTNGEETFLVSENQSTYIPVATVHALENPGKLPLELIEVQSGSYLGEDDIVRLKDNYGRV